MKHTIQESDVENFETCSTIATSHGMESNKDLHAIVKWDIKSNVCMGFYRVLSHRKQVLETDNLNMAIERYNSLD